MALRQDASTGKMVDDGKPVALAADGDALKDAKGRPMMHVKVYSPFKVYFNQVAYSISGENTTGPFDILPRHHNFITLLKPCDLMLNTEAGQPKIRIASGVMHVKADQVTVFLDV